MLFRVSVCERKTPLGEKPAYIVGQGDIVYPESDGQPIADNTKQFRWIMTIQGGLEAMFRDTPDVFVAGGERARAERLATRLRALGVDPDRDESEEGA
jgi:hypothetical protein